MQAASNLFFDPGLFRSGGGGGSSSGGGWGATSFGSSWGSTSFGGSSSFGGGWDGGGSASFGSGATLFGSGGSGYDRDGFGSQGFQASTFVNDRNGNHTYQDGHVLSQLPATRVTPEGMTPASQQTGQNISGLFSEPSSVGENAADRALLGAQGWMGGVRERSRGIVDNASNPAEAVIGAGAYAVNSVTNAVVDGAVQTGRLVTSTEQRRGFMDGMRRLWNDPVGTAKDSWTAFRTRPRDDQLAHVGAGLVGLGAIGKIGRFESIDDAVDISVAERRIPQTGGGGIDELADNFYEAIRNSTIDVQMIADNTGFKPRNIQKVKDHVFYDEHILDRFVDQGIPARVGRFDSSLPQAKAWARLENGIHTADDITWLKHETAERWFEKRYGSGYSEAHDRVDSRWSGSPWRNDDAIR